MATCKGCGLSGSWQKRGKKWGLLEPNGERHRCLAYRPAKKKAEFSEKVGPTIAGENYRQPCGQCPAKPWESCRCYPGMAEQINAEADARFTRMLDLLEQA